MAIISTDLTPVELTAFLSLPDAALATSEEAAAYLRLKCNTLAWYRCNGGGPPYVRVGSKAIRYRIGDLREYAKGQPMSDGVRRAAQVAMAARTAKSVV